MYDWIAKLYDDPDLLRMGHDQRKQDLNLGLGWMYYAMARILRPQTVVVIGSLRGFVPMLFGKALLDNGEDGEVIFIDPSLADDFWKDPAQVQEHFRSHGITNIRHYLMTTQAFVETEMYQYLGDLGIVFVDGYHSEEQARFDHHVFEHLMAEDGMVFFHDSTSNKESHIYGADRAYVHTVRNYVEALRARADLEVFELDHGMGVAMVRKLQAPA